MAGACLRGVYGALVVVLAAVLATGAGRAQDEAERIPVDLELVLAVDISGSMDYEEQLIQRDGYVAGFRDESVISALLGGYRGRVAVTYMEWANEFTQHQVVPWTVIDSREGAEAFAAAIEASPLNTARGTSISGALQRAGLLISSNRYDGARRVIDISGDGSNRDGPPVGPIRDRIAAQGVTINGLPLILRPSGRRFEMIDLDAYYRENVIAGPGAFSLAVRDVETLGSSIRSKLILEIAGTAGETEHAALDRETPRALE